MNSFNRKFLMKEDLLDFKENNYAITLKYDGERISKKYTIVLASLLKIDNKCLDTDSFEAEIVKMIEKEKINITMNFLNKFISTFKNLLCVLIKKYNENIVFNFSIVNDDEGKYKVYLKYFNEYKYFKTKCFEDIINQLELNIG